VFSPPRAMMPAMSSPEQLPRATSALHAFLRAFPYAWNGLVECAAHQRNMRVHLVLGVLACAFAALAPMGGAERAVLLACVGLVLAAEASNSAIEALVDLLQPTFHERARAAKDAAAGSVLAAAGASALVLVAVAGGHGAELWSTLRVSPLPAAAAAVLAAIDAVALAAPRWSLVPWAPAALGLVAWVPLARAASGTAGAAGALLLHLLASAASRRRAKL
jgi:diacylglycerol kinase (ATP)